MSIEEINELFYIKNFLEKYKGKVIPKEEIIKIAALKWTA